MEGAEGGGDRRREAGSRRAPEGHRRHRATFDRDDADGEDTRRTRARRVDVQHRPGRRQEGRRPLARPRDQLLPGQSVLHAHLSSRPGAQTRTRRTVRTDHRDEDLPGRLLGSQRSGVPTTYHRTQDQEVRRRDHGSDELVVSDHRHDDVPRGPGEERQGRLRSHRNPMRRRRGTQLRRRLRQDRNAMRRRRDPQFGRCVRRKSAAMPHPRSNPGLQRRMPVPHRDLRERRHLRPGRGGGVPERAVRQRGQLHR